MSLYKSAVVTAVTSLPKGYRRKPKGPKPVGLIHVQSVIKTPHGPVIAGELVHAEFVPGVGSDIGSDEIGFFKKFGRGLKKAGRGIGRGAKKAGKGVGKAGRGGFRVVKRTGKVVAKGSKGAVKWAARNPIKALTLPVGGGVFLAAKALTKKKKRGKTPLALGPMNPTIPGGITAEGQADAKALDAASDSGPMSDDQGSPSEADGGGPAEAEEGTEATQDEQQSGETESADAEESSDSEESADDGASDDDSEVSGMPNEEWVGLDEIAGVGDEYVGDEDVGSDDIGAVRKKVAPKGPRSALVRQKGYTKTRRQPLPFNSVGTVAAAASAVVTQIPQTLFRGRRLVIGAAAAAGFTIEDIKVGNVSQTASMGSIPGEAFGPTTTGDDNIQMDTCPPGMMISMSVTNTTAGALQFRAVMFGDSVQ